MQEEKIKVSVIMPVYNSGKYLKTAVDSILNQSLKEIELILVDDGSTDGSSERCDEYAKRDRRVRVIHQQNGGICAARNAALAIAKGEYIGFSDHDDEYVPDYLKVVYERALSENADFVKVENKGVYLKNGVKYKEDRTHFKNKIYDREEIRKTLFKLIRMNVLTCVWDGIYRNDIIKENNICFDGTYKHGGEDIDFMLQLVAFCHRIVTIDEVFYLHYLRKGFSTSAKFHPDILSMLEKRFATLNNTMKMLNISIDSVQKDYTIYYTKEYVANYIRYISNQHCSLSWKEKRDKIESLYKKPYLYPFVLKQSFLSIYRISKLYGIVYFFFKHHWLLPNYIIYKTLKKQ